MEATNEISGLLDLMVQPAFSVRNGQICDINAAAQGRLITRDMQLPKSSQLHTVVSCDSGKGTSITRDNAAAEILTAPSRTKKRPVFHVKHRSF